MHKLPLTLIYSRLVMGAMMIIFSIADTGNFKVLAVSLIALGLVSDILDGIIARRLGISSEKLRRLDSSVDQAFWCMVAISAFIKYPGFFYHNYIQLIILISAEALTYVVSYARFGKEVATHAISSKIWTLILFATLIQIMVSGNSFMLFQVCFYVGLLTRFEITAILFIIRAWTNDVPSVYHAVLLRQGKPIRRHKLFNG